MANVRLYIKLIVIIWFIVLHNPDGTEVLIKADEIVIISPAAKGESKGACSRLMMHGIYYWIKECPDEIKKAKSIELFDHG